MSSKGKKSKIRQVKVLAVAATPLYSDDVEIEKEQELLLDALISTGLEQRELYIEMPDTVRRTVSDIPGLLKHRTPDILFVICHAYDNSENKTVLAMTEDDGTLEEVTPKKLAATVKDSGHIPGVVILWNHPAKYRDILHGEAAKMIYNAGIPRVIGFRKTLSREAAREFVSAFTGAVAARATVEAAFNTAKDAVAAGEKLRLDQDPNWRPIDEADSPVLFCQGKPLEIADTSGPALAAALPDTHPLAGSAYRSHGFVGRSAELRAIFKHIDSGETAVVIHGQSGTGKSAVLTRAVSLLKQEKYIPILFRGEISAERVLEQISDAASKKGVKDADKIFESSEPYKEKLEKLLDPFIFKYKLLLLFEDFGINQDTEGNFKNERLKELVNYLKDELKEKNTLMFFSTRFAIPKFTGVELHPLDMLHFRKLAVQFPAMRKLDEKDLKYFYFEMGGYPRALQWCDALARHRFGSKPFKWEELRQSVPGLKERILHKESETADFSYLLVEPLLELLTPVQRKMLEICSIFRGDVPAGALAYHGIELATRDRFLLEETGLLSYIRKERIYQVSRLASRAVGDRMADDYRAALHKKNADFFRSIGQDKTARDITVKVPDETTGEQKEKKVRVLPHDHNHIEARYHLLEAGDTREALELTAAMDTYFSAIGFPQLAFDLVKDMESHIDDLEDNEKILVHQRLAFFYAVFGKLDDAVTQHNAMLEIFHNRGNREGEAVSRRQLAMLYEAQAKYAEALPHLDYVIEYQKEKNNHALVATLLDKAGLQLKMEGKFDEARDRYLETEKINRETGDNIALGRTLEQLGRIHDEQGQFDEAMEYYEKSLKLREEANDRPGIAVLVHQMGNVNFFRGRLDTAFPLYERALALNMETANHKSAGYSQGQIGLIWQRRGEIVKALDNFRQSLAFFEKDNEEKGMAASHHQIGRILEGQGKRDEALKHYEKALEIREKTGDLLGAAITYGQLGMLFYLKEEYEPALKYSAQAYAIFTRYGSPNADLARNNMLRLRQKLTREKFESILAEYNIKTEPSNKT